MYRSPSGRLCKESLSRSPRWRSDLLIYKKVHKNHLQQLQVQASISNQKRKFYRINIFDFQKPIGVFFCTKRPRLQGTLNQQNLGKTQNPQQERPSPNIPTLDLPLCVWILEVFLYTREKHSAASKFPSGIIKKKQLVCGSDGTHHFTMVTQMHTLSST